MEVHLGPRLIIVGRRLRGTCEDLKIDVAESTWEAIRDLEEADQIILQKYSALTTKVGGYEKASR